MQPYFVWKGIDSRVMGLWVQKYPPITRPPMRYQSVTIPGRPGALTLLEGQDVYEAYVREMTIMPKPGADIHSIVKWLTGAGEVTFGLEPDRVQTARIYDEVELSRQFADQRSAVARFLCDPFKRNTFYREPISIDLTQSSYTLVGQGDVLAYPKFELVGTGSCTLTVGTTQIAMALEGEELTGEMATIDCETRTAYRTVTEGLTSHIEPIVTHGDFCTIPHDENTLIQWSEGVTELRVWPRWRWF